MSKWLVTSLCVFKKCKKNVKWILTVSFHQLALWWWRPEPLMRPTLHWNCGMRLRNKRDLYHRQQMLCLKHPKRSEFACLCLAHLSSKPISWIVSKKNWVNRSYFLFQSSFQSISLYNINNIKCFSVKICWTFFGEQCCQKSISFSRSSFSGCGFEWSMFLVKAGRTDLTTSNCSFHRDFKLLLRIFFYNDNDNGLLFHMTQPISRSTIKAIACSKPTISEH